MAKTKKSTSKKTVKVVKKEIVEESIDKPEVIEAKKEDIQQKTTSTVTDVDKNEKKTQKSKEKPKGNKNFYSKALDFLHF